MTDRIDVTTAEEAPRRRVPRPGRRASRLGVFASGAVAMVIALLVFHALVPGPAPLTRRDVTSAIASALASQTPAPPLSEAAWAAIAPSLVIVEATGAPQPSASAGTGGAAGIATASPGIATASPGTSAGPGASPGGSTSPEAFGTGVVVSAAGAILTSLHVVDGATAIRVTFADGTASSATITTRQADQDIAVLTADTPPATITPAVLGNPGALRVGSEVYVVGNPFGLAGSMSAGVVSGLHRTFQLPNGGAQLKELIQVDAAVNPGNSGGPLLDRNGRVVGIVAALVNPTSERVFIGIGLAVPINRAGGAAGLPQY
jgi:serine protease DegQ